MGGGEVSTQLFEENCFVKESIVFSVLETGKLILVYL